MRGAGAAASEELGEAVTTGEAAVVVVIGGGNAVWVVFWGAVVTREGEGVVIVLAVRSGTVIAFG